MCSIYIHTHEASDSPKQQDGSIPSRAPSFDKDRLPLTGQMSPLQYIEIEDFEEELDREEEDEEERRWKDQFRRCLLHLI